MYFQILEKLSPLYMNILLGYLASRILKTPRDTIATLMFFLINPLVLFNGIIHTKIDVSTLSLPIIIFCIASALCFIFYKIGKKIWSDSTTNLLAFNAGTGNSGYFGLPLALILFDNQGEGVYLMSIIGLGLYDNSVGFYACAKGNFSSKECLKQIAKLPTIYAFAAGLIFHYLAIPIPTIFKEFMCHIKGTYTVLGMMILGLGIATLRNFLLDIKFITLTFLVKFLIWPLTIFTLIFLDKNFFCFYNDTIYQALILLSIVPLAVNSVVLASLLDTQPEKAAAAVLLSILFALLYVPFMVIYFIIDPNNLPNLYRCY